MFDRESWKCNYDICLSCSFRMILRRSKQKPRLPDRQFFILLSFKDWMWSFLYSFQGTKWLVSKSLFFSKILLRDSLMIFKSKVSLSSISMFYLSLFQINCQYLASSLLLCFQHGAACTAVQNQLYFSDWPD